MRRLTLNRSKNLSNAQHVRILESGLAIVDFAEGSKLKFRNNIKTEMRPRKLNPGRRLNRVTIDQKRG